MKVAYEELAVIYQYVVVPEKQFTVGVTYLIGINASSASAVPPLS